MKPSALLLALAAAGVATPGTVRASEDFCSRLVIYAVQQVCQLLGNGLSQCQPVGVAGPAPGCAQPGTPAYWPVVMGPPVIQMPPALPQAPLLPNPYLAWNARPYGMMPGLGVPAVPFAPMGLPSIPMPARDATPVAAVLPQPAAREAASTVAADQTGQIQGVMVAGERRMSDPEVVRLAMGDAVLDNLADTGQSPEKKPLQEAAPSPIHLPGGDDVTAGLTSVVASTSPGDGSATPAAEADADPSAHAREAVTAADSASTPLSVTQPMTMRSATTPPDAAVVEHDAPQPSDRPATVAAAPGVVAREQAVIDETKAHFAFDSAELTDAGRTAIDAWLRQVPAGMRVRLTGHADRLGPAPYNVELSRRRAEAVRAYLVQRGYAAGDIRVLAKGESEPVKHCPGGATPATKACLAPNRRVEIAQD